MIRGLHHTAISTPDLDRALGFWRDLLGFHVFDGGEWQPGSPTPDEITGLNDSSAAYVLLDASNTAIELFEFRSPVGARLNPQRTVADHGITHVCLDVTDIQGEYVRLRDAGVPFQSPPVDFGGGIHCAYGRDPDGNVVELQEVPPNYAPELGRWT